MITRPTNDMHMTPFSSLAYCDAFVEEKKLREIVLEVTGKEIRWDRAPGHSNSISDVYWICLRNSSSPPVDEDNDNSSFEQIVFLGKGQRELIASQQYFFDQPYNNGTCKQTEETNKTYLLDEDDIAKSVFEIVAAGSRSGKRINIQDDLSLSYFNLAAIVDVSSTITNHSTTGRDTIEVTLDYSPVIDFLNKYHGIGRTSGVSFLKSESLPTFDRLALLVDYRLKHEAFGYIGQDDFEIGALKVVGDNDLKGILEDMRKEVKLY